MAATGYTPISLYYSATATNAPTAGNLVNGELAINITDGKLYYKDNAGAVQLIASKSVAAGIFLGTGAITIPAGTTAQQPTGVQGMLRFNTTTTSFEGYNGTAWGAIGGGGGGSTFTRTDFTATAGQTVFTVSYTVGNIDVYRNGIKLGIADFTATNGTSITLANAAVVGDLIETMSFTTVSIANTVASFSGGTTGFTPSTATTGAVTLAGTLAIANGGTNSTATPTAGGAGYGTGTAHAYTAAGTSGQPLISAGASAPAFGNLALGTANTNVSGALTPTNGGTGVATLTGIAYGNGTSAFTAASTAQVLAVVGTLPIANGGTNSTATATAGGIGYGTGTAHAYTAAGTSGQVLTSQGAGAPIWAAASSGGGTGGLYVPFTGVASRATAVMTVSAITGGAIQVGDTIKTQDGVTSFGTVVSFGTGTGGTGTYNMSASGTIASSNVMTTSATFTIPTGITSIQVWIAGGGGGGGGSYYNSCTCNPSFDGKGGGGSGSTTKIYSGLTPGNTLTVTVGNLGVGGAVAAAGSSGGTSSVSSGTQSIVTCSATGGVGAAAYNSPFGGPGGAGGAGSGGSLAIFNLTGGTGTSGYAGGAGGSPSTTIAVGATFPASGGTGSATVGNSGTYGGGGQGGGATSASYAGGNGGFGYVFIKY